MSISRRGKSAAVVPPTSWSKASSQAARSALPGKTRRSASPTPLTRGELSKLRSPFDDQSNDAPAPGQAPTYNDDDARDDAYESDGNLSIPSSFTRTCAALSIGHDYEQGGDDGDDESFFALPSFGDRPGPVDSKQDAGHIEHIDIIPLPSPSRGQNVSESWDEDFVFSREATQEDVKDQGKSAKDASAEDDSSSDSFDEESRWDSDENRGGAGALLSDSTNTRANGEGRKNRLYKTTSSQTITAQDRVSEAPAQSLPQWPNRPTTPVRSTGPTKTATQSPFPLASSPARIPSRLDSLKRRSEATLLRTAPSAPARAQTSQRNLARASPPKSVETSSSTKMGMFSGKSKVASSTVAGNTPEKRVDQPSSLKKTSLGRMETHLSKIFSSRIGRRRESISSGLNAAYTKPSNASEKTMGEASPLHKAASDKIGDSSPPSVGQARAQGSSRTTLSTSPAGKTTHMPPRDVPHAASSSRLASPDQPPTTPVSYTPRTLPRRKRTDDSGSERRHWASMLDDADLLPRDLRSAQATSQIGRLDAKRKVSDTDEKRIPDAQPPLPANFGNATRTSRQASSASVAAPRIVSARSVSDSTTTSGGRTSSAASSLSTAPTIDSGPAGAQPGDLASPYTVRRSRLSSTASKDGEGTSSSDSRYTQGLRSSTPKRPPPVSSGLDNLARRQPSLSQLSPANAAVSTTDELFARQAGAPEGSMPRTTARRNSLGDLKIPTRISKVQDGVRADMMRIRDFARGIEELKGLREAYQRALERFDEFVSEEGNSIADELKRSRYTYESWWECAEVLIGLADGKETQDAGRKDDSGDFSLRPRVSPTPSMHSAFLCMQHQQGSVRRHGEKSSSSRASSNASRYVHPEREKEILAAMLAGAPPGESTSPPRAEGRHELQRQRTSSTDGHVWRSPSAPSFHHRRGSSQRQSVDVRRTSDSDSVKEYSSVQGLKIDVALANGSPQRRPTRRSGVPIPSSSSSKHAAQAPGSSLLGTDMARQGSGGRRRLRSAGQLGLQSLRDLVVTLRSNTMLRSRPIGQDPVIARPPPPRSRTSSRESFAARRQAVMDDATRTVRTSNASFAPTASGTDRPLLYRAAATTPSFRRSSRIGSGSSNRNSDLDSSRQGVRDLSLDSDWTEADPDSFFGSSSNVEPDTSTGWKGSAGELGRTPSLAPAPRAKASSARSNAGNHLMGMVNSSTSSLARPKKDESGAITGRFEVHAEAPPTPPAVPRIPSSIRLQQNEGTPAQALPRISRQRSPSMTEQTSSTDSSKWSARGGSAHGRMRVMSADHIDVSAVQMNQATSNAFRELAMRPEAIPSLNRYLDATRSQCRECLSVMKQLEMHFSPLPQPKGSDAGSALYG